MAVQNIVRTFAGMKQLRLLIVASVLMLLVGCLQDKVGVVRIYSDPSVELYSIPNQVSMFLFHASGPWTATSPEPWLQVMKESGPGGTDTLKVVTTQKNLTGQERKVLCILARKRESVMMFRLIKSIDPNAFVSQSSVIGVYGEGFDEMKVKVEVKDNKENWPNIWRIPARKILRKTRALTSAKRMRAI